MDDFSLAELVGFEGEQRRFRAAIEGARSHHAWLLSGPEGLGKALFAMHAASWLLGAPPQGEGITVSPDELLARRIAHDGHGGVLWLRRIADEKGKKPAVIDVAAVRRINAFFGMTSGEGDRRVVIIDSLDELSREASNALLKNLEEPPKKAVFLLINHNPNATLETILSRCMKLRFAPLPDPTISQLLTTRTSANDADAAQITAFAQGRPGRALGLYERGALDWIKKLETLMRRPEAVSALQVKALIEPLLKPDAQEQRDMVLDLLAGQSAQKARQSEGAAAAIWASAYQACIEARMRINQRYLDPSLVFQDLFQQFAKMERDAA